MRKLLVTLGFLALAIGLIWIVTSRLTSDDQAIADFCTSTTPPSVTLERKVMMAMSSIRVRPATERAGTIGVVLGCGGRAATVGVPGVAALT